MYSPLSILSWILEGMGCTVGWRSEGSTAVVVDGCSRLTWTGAGACTTGRGLECTGKEAADRRSSSTVSSCVGVACATPVLVGLWACWRIAVSWLRSYCGSAGELSPIWSGELCCELALRLILTTWVCCWELLVSESSMSTEILAREECKCECKQSTKTDFFPVIGSL